MLNVTVIHGSPRKGNTYKAARIVMGEMSRLGKVSFTVARLMLKKYTLRSQSTDYEYWRGKGWFEKNPLLGGNGQKT